jgi:hypothetical protein
LLFRVLFIIAHLQKKESLVLPQEDQLMNHGGNFQAKKFPYFISILLRQNLCKKPHGRVLILDICTQVIHFGTKNSLLKYI